MAIRDELTVLGVPESQSPGDVEARPSLDVETLNFC